MADNGGGQGPDQDPDVPGGGDGGGGAGGGGTGNGGGGGGTGNGGGGAGGGNGGGGTGNGGGGGGGGAGNGGGDDDAGGGNGGDNNNDDDANNGGGNNGGNGNQGGSSSTTRLIIPPTAPVGEIIFTQPLPTQTSYYKLAPGNLITFGWNFTYVLATPTHLTVSATCEGGNRYPVGPTDGIIPGTATEVVWDPYAYQQNNRGTPLPPANCNLMICDERGYGAPRRAGYLAPNSALQFALYTPQAYTPLASGELLLRISCFRKAHADYVYPFS